MLGHMSGAYAARVSKDLSVCSRFDFNVYSYESEWAMGAEWWTRRFKSQHRKEPLPLPVPDSSPPSLPLDIAPVQPTPQDDDDITGVVKARASTTAVCRLLAMLVMSC